MTQTNFPATVRQLLSEYKLEYLRCRGTMQHFWDFKSDYNIATNTRGRIIEFTRTRTCISCATQSDTVFTVEKDGSFVFQKRRYRYSEGYIIRKGTQLHDLMRKDPRSVRARLREELFFREMVADLDAELTHRLAKQMQREAS